MRVELDGEPWRTLPAAAIVETRLVVGAELDRERARKLGRELRRQAALTLATKAIAHRERSTAAVSATLERQGVGNRERVEALNVLGRSGYLDDRRFAARRAAVLAERGYGDEGIRVDLERDGLPRELIDEALETITPELSRARAIVEVTGASGKTLRRLVSKGFSEDAIETALGFGLSDDG